MSCRYLTWSIAVVFAVSLTYAADHETFKNCSRVPFCTDLRSKELSDNTVYSINGSEIINNVAYISLTSTTLDELRLKISIVDDDIIRINISESSGKNSRYQLDELILKEHKSAQPLYITNSDNSYILRGVDSKRVEVIINQGPPFSIEFWRDSVRQLVFKGDRFTYSVKNGSYNFDLSFANSDVLYGLSHHADTIGLRDTIKENIDPYRLRNSDTPQYEINSTMALYGAIPVVYGHSVNSTTGIFLMNAAEQWIDINYGNGSEISKPNAHFMVANGSLDLFVFLGPTPREVVRQYTSVTGMAHMPQMWTLGYHQCRWSYYTQEKVKEVIATMDANDFPMDAIWLDIDYTDGKRYFTWNPENYSDPVEMQKNISSTHRKLVVILDPHIKVDEDYSVYSSANKSGLFVKWENGSNFEGNCWPGESSWLDFLNPDAVKFYAGLYSYDSFSGSTETLAGVWNDMNEPSVFTSPADENTISFETEHTGKVKHGEIHNIYGFLQTRATWTGLLHRDNGTKRPFVLTRSHFAGSQRYTAMWTGDNTADWPYLAVSYSECLTSNMLGQVWCGADIGGFHNVPDEQLVQRWFQAGAWIPFYRGHAEQNQPFREPYTYSEEAQAIIRNALKLRYKHLPAWYTLFYEHTRYGDPVIRPLFYHYPEDSNCFNVDNQLLVGRDIMARAVTEPNVTTVEVYFPGNSTDYWYQINDNSVHIGGQWESITVDMSYIPVYYRGGSIIVRKDQERRSSTDMISDEYTLIVNLDKDGKANGTLYNDDLTSFQYRDGKAYDYIVISMEQWGGLAFERVDPDTNHVDYEPLFEKIVINQPSSSTDNMYYLTRETKQQVFTKAADGRHLREVSAELRHKNKVVIKLY